MLTQPPAPASMASSAHAPADGKPGLRTMMVGALGVVFGDIGTSPLYTLKEAFSEHYGLKPDHDTVLGILSLVFWALMLVVTLKYVIVIMKADNDGEGGIMALTALAQRVVARNQRAAYLVGVLGIFGASLFFGDGVITPAISVLSAIEGLEVAAPSMERYVVPATLVVLVLLFLAQRHGTARVGKLFGPITAVWFVVLAVLGLVNIVAAPEVLQALNPWWGVRFFMQHNWHAVFVLGAVVLAVTGGEALYADMGHFGRLPIRTAWLFIVLPSLTLNYLGQGALVLSDPRAVDNPFYQAVPGWALFPMIGLATMATVIASQAVITGAYSVAQQAMQLGYIPRMRIKHTSRDTMGQIYVPMVNWFLLLMVVVAVVSFGNSTALATAYGVSVTGTMLITSILMIVYLRGHRRLPELVFWPLAALFVAIDVAFFYANIVKFLDGAWFPLLLGLVLFLLMRTWRRGRRLIEQEVRKDGIMVANFLPALMLSPPARVSGTAVFLTSAPDLIPQALMHNLKHNKVLHERNVLLTVQGIDEPYAPADQRFAMEAVADNFYSVQLRFGFMEQPDVPVALRRGIEQAGLDYEPMDTTYFAGRETVIPCADRGMPVWRDRLFAVMHRNAAPATGFFRIPPNRLIEVGAQVEI